MRPAAGAEATAADARAEQRRRVAGLYAGAAIGLDAVPSAAGARNFAPDDMDDGHAEPGQERVDAVRGLLEASRLLQGGVPEGVVQSLAHGFGMQLAMAAPAAAAGAGGAAMAPYGFSAVQAQIGGTLTAGQVRRLDEAIDRAIRPHMVPDGHGGSRRVTVPLADDVAPQLFASFSSALVGADDGPSDPAMLGATRGTAALVKRAEMRLESRGRATPPKQILQLITGRTKFINLRAFGCVDLDAISAANAGVVGVDVQMAGGAVVKAAGKPKPREWPLVCDYLTMRNVLDGMIIALDDAPPVMRDGLAELADELLARYNKRPTLLSWPRLYRLVQKIAQKRADVMQRAHISSSGVTVTPWNELDLETEIGLAAEIAAAETGGGGRSRDDAADEGAERDRKKKKREEERERKKREADAKSKNGGGDAKRQKPADEAAKPPTGYKHGDKITKNWVCDVAVWKALPAVTDYCWSFCTKGKCSAEKAGRTCRFKHSKPPDLDDALYRGT